MTRAASETISSATVKSWILAGPTEVGVLDAQLAMPEAEKVVALIKQQNMKLAWVWISHARKPKQ